MVNYYQTSIDLLTLLLRASPSPVPEYLLVNGFPVLIKKVLKADDSSILQGGTDCVSAFVGKAAAQLITWYEKFRKNRNFFCA